MDTKKRFSAKWRDLLTEIQAAFPSPWKETGDDQIFENTFLSAESMGNRTVSLPLYPSLKPEEVLHVVDVLKSAINDN